MTTPFKPDRWPTVTPRLFTADVEGLAAFLRATFDATGDCLAGRPAEMRIGESIIMVSDGAGMRRAAPGFLYVYVEDADDTWRKAVAAGARSIEPPTDMPYGDRRSMVEDPWGNAWQIATFRPR